jgi:hypothetical protein
MGVSENDQDLIAAAGLRSSPDFKPVIQAIAAFVPPLAVPFSC